MDRIQSGVTTPGQSVLGSDGDERLLHIPQSSSITVAMLTKERHGEHKKVDRKTYTFK